MIKTLFYTVVFPAVWSLAGCQTLPPTPLPLPEASFHPVYTQADRKLRLLAQVHILDSLMARYQQENHLPSIAYALVGDEGLLYHQSLGVTHVLQGRRPDEHTPYRIASMTKSLTAMAILKLQEMGHLELHHPAEDYLPELASLKYPSPDAPRITVHHLLTMTAGFPEDNPWGDRQLSDTDEELLALVRAGISFSTLPGSTFEYSNLGYALLGQIIQRVSGQPYRRFMQEQIFQPLGLQESYWDFDGPMVQTLAQGYRWEEEQWKEEPLLKDGAYACMGGLISTLADWSKYMAYLLSAWTNETMAGPISKASLRLMQSPWAFRSVSQRLDASGKFCAESSFYGYGLGWRRTCQSRTYLAHGGGLPGYGSIHVFIPELGLGVVAFSNGTYAGVGVPAVKALDSIIQVAQLEPKKLIPSRLLRQAKTQLETLLPELGDELADSIFAENFYLDEPKSLRRAHLQTLFARAGALKSSGDLIPQNNLRGTFQLDAERGILEVFFTMSPETQPRIQALDVKFIPRE